MHTAPRASLWCAHPRLKPGESISSWLHRCAFANGLSNHSYCRRLFGERAIWNRDVDHVVDDAMLLTAAAATLETPERLRQGTLDGMAGIVFAAEDLRGGHFPWVLSLGVYHRTRRRHGQQFCVACLSADPWLRLHWRLAWSVCCVDHRCLLQDACPSCDAPFVFHRMSLAVAGRLECHACGANVLRASSVRSANSQFLRFQQRMQRGLASGTVVLEGTQRVAALDYFDGLRILAKGVFNNKRLVGLEQALPPVQKRDAPSRPTKKSIEHWRVGERAFAMDVLRRTLHAWPAEFEASCRRAGIYRARFEARFPGHRTPAWINQGFESVRRR